MYCGEWIWCIVGFVVFFLWVQDVVEGFCVVVYDVVCYECIGDVRLFDCCVECGLGEYVILVQVVVVFDVLDDVFCFVDLIVVDVVGFGMECFVIGVEEVFEYMDVLLFVFC